MERFGRRPPLTTHPPLTLLPRPPPPAPPQMIKSIKAAVTIPVMAKARIGHFVEAQILEALGVDYVDESEVLTPADDIHHINKHNFKVPFVCGCRDLGEALRRVAEGAAMIRTKGEAGTGNVVEAVRHARAVQGAIRQLQTMDDDELYVYAKVRRRGGSGGREGVVSKRALWCVRGGWGAEKRAPPG